MAKETAEAEGEEPEKKSKMGLIIGIVAGVIMLIGGVGAGIVLGPKLVGSPPPPAAAAGKDKAKAEAEEEEEEDEEPAAPEKVVSAKFDPIVIDLRGRRGEVHHLKVGLAAELRDGTTEDEFKLVTPRGREAALSYLRTLSLKDVTDPKKYSKIKKELGKRVRAAVGKKRVVRILLVDFVAQ